MSVLDKLLDAVKLNDDYDEDDFLDDDILDESDDDFLDDDEEEKPVKKFFQKFGKKKEDDYDEYDELDDEEEEEPVQKFSPKSASSVSRVTPVKQEKPIRTSSSKITPMRSSRRSSQSVNMEVCVIKPTSMEDTREIADTLVDNSTVILNLEGIDVELAQRIIDFTSGACYSLGGEVFRRYPAISLYWDHPMLTLPVISRIFWEDLFRQ